MISRLIAPVALALSAAYLVWRACTFCDVDGPAGLFAPAMCALAGMLLALSAVAITLLPGETEV